MLFTMLFYCPTSFRATTNSPITSSDLLSKNILYHNQLLHVGVCNGKCFINQPHLAVKANQHKTPASKIWKACVSERTENYRKHMAQLAR